MAELRISENPGERRATVQVDIEFVQLKHAGDLPPPAQASGGSAGWDLVAAIDADIHLAPLERTLVPTGLAIAVPPGFEAQLRARSGRARKEGLALVNAPGTIDSDYRGEVGVLIINLGQEPVVIRRGDRIAQLVISRVPQVRWVQKRAVDSLSATSRGDGGFGSTGR